MINLLLVEITLFENMTFGNVVNILFGILFGAIISAVVFTGIYAKKVQSKYSNPEIRKISVNAYNNDYVKAKKMKDKVVGALKTEIEDVAKLSYPHKKYPLYELSVNDVINGILIIQKKLKTVVSNPLFKDIKYMHISSLLSLEEIAKPITKIVNNKFIKFCMKVWNYIKPVVNILNPVWWIKFIISKTVFKQGKKDVIILAFDFVGNTTYEIYNDEKIKEQKLLENKNSNNG